MTLPDAFESALRFRDVVRASADRRWAFAAAAAAVAVLFSIQVGRTRRRGTITESAAHTALVLVVIGVGLREAWRLAWISDDAFITFRYAEHLAHGDGLVFNVGERVEGYTDFLWAVILAGAIKLHLDPARVAMILGLASYAGCVAVTAKLARWLTAGDAANTLPLAASFVAFGYGFASFATSGLETMFCALLVALLLERLAARRLLQAGVLGVMATLGHPDHVLFFAGGLAAVALSSAPSRARRLTAYAAPFVALYVPYFAWRTCYYGDLFPNTFYAKSGGVSYFSQGAKYLVVSTLGSGLWGALPLALLGVVLAVAPSSLRRRERRARGFGHAAWRCDRPTALRAALIGTAAYTPYVAKIGGDFMLSRLLVPAIPPIAVFGELAVARLVSSARRSRRSPRASAAYGAVAVLGAAIAAVALCPIRLIAPYEKAWFVADERTFYPLQSFSPLVVDSGYFRQGTALAKAFTDRGVRPRIAMDAVGMIGYLSRLPLIDVFGLTDRMVAHMPIAERGRPGHEKRAPDGDLLRRADLSISPPYPPPYDAWTAVDVAGMRLYLARASDEIARALDPSHPAPNVGRELGRWELLAPESNDRAQCDAWFFSHFFASDAAARAHTASRAEGLGLVPHAARALLFADDPEAPPGFREVAREGFEQLDDPAFRAEAPRRGQAPLFGTHGRYVNTFDARDGDALTKTITLDIPKRGDFATLQLAGGLRHSKREVYVRLTSGGRELGSASGCNTETLGTRVFDLRHAPTSTLHLEIVDDATGAWGHLLMDDFVQWVPTKP